MTIQTSFVMSASLWQDVDLPITYSLYYMDPLSGQSTVIQSRSETSYGTSKLPAGDASRNFTIISGVFVYDNLDAMSTKEFPGLKVNEVPAIDLQSILLRTMDDGDGANIDDKKQSIAIATSTVNNVDCT